MAGAGCQFITVLDVDSRSENHRHFLFRLALIRKVLSCFLSSLMALSDYNHH